MSTERPEVYQIDMELRVTLKDLQSSIIRLIKEKQVSETAKILWVASVTNQADDPYSGIMPGSILMGLEWLENGEPVNGTLRIEPPVVTSKYLN